MEHGRAWACPRSLVLGTQTWYHMENVKNRPTNHCPPPPNPYPWLVYRQGKTAKNQSFYSLTDPQQKIHVRSIPELRSKKVWTSRLGWLVLSHEADTDFHLWNPLTLQSIQLPRLVLKPKQSIQDCLLTSSPDDLDSTYILLLDDPRSIAFCCIREKKWITRGYNEEIKYIGTDANDRFWSLVTCNGQIYATTGARRRMVLIEIIQRSRLVLKPLNCSLPYGASWLTCKLDDHLVECCGDLFSIRIDYGGAYWNCILGILVCKLDFPSMTWNEVDSCPGRAFFLSERRAISCPAIDSDKTEGRIYFTREDDNKLYSYNIADKSIAVSLPCPQIPTPWKTPIWVMADSRIQDTPTETKNYANQEGEGLQENRALRGRTPDPSTKEDKGATKQNLLDFPKDILEKISTHLTLIDYMNFRSLNRECRSVALTKPWRTASVNLDSQIETPWLMVPDKVKGIRSLVDPIFGGRYYVSIPKTLENAIVCYSKHGWLLMLTLTNDSFMFFNPLTKSTIHLPDFHPFAESFWFLSSPDSSDCIVVGAAFDYQVVIITRPGMTEWRIVPFEYEISFRHCRSSCPVLLQSTLYFLGDNGDLATLTLDEDIEDSPSVEVLNVQKPCSSFHEIFLVECGGKLLSVAVGKGGKSVQVFKFNLLALAWEKVNSLGNYTLYLGRVSSIATEAKSPGMENKIYFPRFRGESIVFYSLATGKFHTSENGDSLTDYIGTREQLLCSWIEPRR